jgi:hypothetical protein
MGIMRKENKKIIYICLIIICSIILIFDFIWFGLNLKINFLYQPYAAQRLILVFNNQESEASDAFLLNDVKAIAKSGKQSAVISDSLLNQNKNLKDLVNAAQDIYVNIFSNDILNSNKTTAFKNKYAINLPLEVKSHLSENNNLQINYDAKAQIINFILPGQTLYQNNKYIKLSDINVFSLNQVKSDSVLKIGDLFINLANYRNDFSLSVYYLIKNEVALYQNNSHNLLADYNPSFENGLWSESVADCSAYLPGEAQVFMALSADAKVGDKALQLNAKNHFACTNQIFSLKLDSDKLYRLAFDYKNLGGEKVQYYYNLRNDLGNNQDKFETFEASDDNWQTFQTIINPKLEKINAFDLYFYAPSDGSQEITNLYDNVKLEEYVPKGLDSYYLYGHQNIADTLPVESIKVLPINNWESKISLRNVSRSFLFVYPKNYDSNQKLYLNNNTGSNIIDRIQALVQPPLSEKIHFQLANGSQAWWLDLKKLCQEKNRCEKNSDGNYDLSLTLGHKNANIFMLTFILGICLLWILSIKFKYGR